MNYPFCIALVHLSIRTYPPSVTPLIIGCHAPVPRQNLLNPQYIFNHQLWITVEYRRFLFIDSGGFDYMKRSWIFLAGLIVLGLVSSVSAYQDITFSQSGDIVVTYVSQNGDYHNAFGVSLPSVMTLGTTHEVAEGTVYNTGLQCVPREPVAVFITTPEQHTYYSNVPGGDGYDHALVVPQVDGSFTVSFENQYGTRPQSDRDFNDVVLNVACIPSTPAPEFPTLALPAGLIVGIFGVVLFVRKTEE
jgi:hypothetical protein